MNKPLQKELWENIKNFALDDPASGFPFSKKLQKENNWSSSFTTKAIDEYRKFIFLCCISPGGASPPDIVDKVWHLHLTYTTNYWNEFCQKTLQKDIHHFPSKGGNEELVKHSEWYRQTLDNYRDVFGTEPPAAIWPPGALNIQKANIDIYDAGFFKKTVLIFAFLTLIFILAVDLFHSTGTNFFFYYAVLMIAGVLVSTVLQEHKLKKLELFIKDHFPIKSSPYQISRFLYGPHRAYQTALVDLLKRDIIDTIGDGYKRTTDPTFDMQKDANPLLPALIENIAIGDTFTYRQGLDAIDNEKLQDSSIAELTGLSKKVDYQKFIVPGIVLLIGFARLFQGLANGKPVNYLVLEIGIFSLFSLMIAAGYSYTQMVFKKSEDVWMSHNNNGHSSDILNNFTLLGVPAIAGFAEYNSLSRVFESEAPLKRNTSSGGYEWGGSSCSGGSDGGSSGCGGGCGGCGGGD